MLHELVRIWEPETGWLQHVTRMYNRMPKIMRNYRPNGQIRLGRPLKTPIDEAEKGLSRSNSWWIIIIIIIIIIEKGFQASAAMLIRSALLWDITQRRVVIVYRRFGTAYRSHLQGSRSQNQEVVLKFLILEYGSDTLSRNVSKGLPLGAM
jgi:hypothetical protein